MKTIFIFSFILVLFGCKEKGAGRKQIQESSAIEVLVDVTDPQKLKLWPNPVPILKLYNCSSSTEQACTFGIQAISDISINRVYQAHLPPQVETEKLDVADDVQHRSKCIIKFYDSVTTLFNRFYSETDTTHSRPYSECWVTIIKTLERLNSQPAIRKFLIIFSDLAENSVVTAYKKGKNLDTATIRNGLEKLLPVPQKITGTKVIIVYQPADRADDLRFTKMFQVYKSILEKHGAVVSTQASNESFE